MPRPASGPKKGPNAHKLPEEIPSGTKLVDLYKNEWQLGTVIGKGGFGLIYLGMILPLYVVMKLVELGPSDVSFFTVVSIILFFISSSLSYWFFQYGMASTGILFYGVGLLGFYTLFRLLLDKASKDTSKQVDLRTAEFVIKIEAKSNGPLFCEMQFYQRAAKPAVIQSFIAEQKLRYLGVPPFIATGSFENCSREYRFLVMNRYGTDLQKILVQCGGRFAPNATFAVGLRMLDALYFLHENEYVHADIKAANILLGYGGGQDIQSEVYLVDFGLAYRYKVEGKHKEYKEDPRKAHDGTIEFTSIDAHKGVSPSRRGDLEILGYCMLQWLGGTLPWEDNLRSPSYVANSKEKYMEDIPSLIKATIPSTDSLSIDCMRKYLIAVKELDYETKPNYTRFKDILKYCLTRGGQADEWIIDFSDRATKRGTKRKSTDSGSPKTKKIKSPSVPKGPKTPLAKKSPAASRRAPKAKLNSSENKVNVKSQVSRSGAKKSSKVIDKAKKRLSMLPSKRSLNKTPDKSLPAGRSPVKRKNFPMPPPTKSLNTNTDAADSNSRTKVIRRRRPNVSLATTAVQTSPGLRCSPRKVDRRALNRGEEKDRNL